MYRGAFNIVSVSDIQSVVRVMNMLSSTHVSVSDIQSVVRVMNMLGSRQ